MNAFQLLKKDKTWLITKIIDTRYREGCKSSKAETIINSRFMKVLNENKVVFYGNHKKQKQFITVTF